MLLETQGTTTSTVVVLDEIKHANGEKKDPCYGIGYGITPLIDTSVVFLFVLLYRM